jgi:hypothetical protein
LEIQLNDEYKQRMTQAPQKHKWSEREQSYKKNKTNLVRSSFHDFMKSSVGHAAKTASAKCSSMIEVPSGLHDCDLNPSSSGHLLKLGGIFDISEPAQSITNSRHNSNTMV